MNNFFEKAKEVSSEAWKATKEGAAFAWEKTKEWSSEAWDATKEGSEYLSEKTEDAWKEVKESVARKSDEKDNKECQDETKKLH